MITISPGHYGVGTGAKGYIDEFTEAKKVSKKVHALLNKAGILCNLIIDEKSKSQRENLSYLVQQHNKTKRELDVSIHFNAINNLTERPIGVGVLYVNRNYKQAAEKVCEAIAKSAGFVNRGAKHRTDLAILNGTHKPCLLVEVCFVNSKSDVLLYNKHFEAICLALAKSLANIVGKDLEKYSNKNSVHSLFTYPELEERLQSFYLNAIVVESILNDGIERRLFQPIWFELWRKGKLTLVDFCGLCTIICCNKK